MLKNRLSFKGKTAIVTGSSRGIGKGIADLLEEQGCLVICTGTKIQSEKKNHLSLNLEDELSIQTFLSNIEQLDRIDVLINNAGINYIEPIDQITTKQWERIIKVNLTGAMIITQAVVKIMKRRKKGGKILNVSSIFSLISRKKRDAYSASKSGLNGLTRASALDLAPDNILVNALCPGFTLTDLTRSILSEKERRELSAEVPLGRMAEEIEIARAAVFLCSDFNTYMTGQTFVVDGGYIIQ